MSVSQIPFTMSLIQVRQHIVYTLTKLTIDPRGTPLVEKWKALRDDWKVLQLQEFDHQDERIECSARLEAQDDLLDGFTDRVDEASEGEARLRTMLFGDKTPFAFKRPIGGVQLKSMETWPGTLSSPDAPERLRLFAEEAGELVKSAKEAVASKDESNRKLKEFYAIGAKKKFIDRLNLLRDETQRYLSQLVSEHPSLGRRYPASFFYQKEGEAVLELEDEISFLRGQIEEGKDNLELLEIRLRELLTKKEALDREASEEKTRLEKIEALKQELALLQSGRRAKS